MTNGPTDVDETEGTDDSGTIDIRPWKLIKKHNLKQGLPHRIDDEDIASIRDRFAATIARYSAQPGNVAKASGDTFEEIFKIPFDGLTDGYFERRPEGVEIVLYGTNSDERTVWLVLAIGFDGSFSVSNKTEVLPGEADYSPPG